MDWLCGVSLLSHHGVHCCRIKAMVYMWRAEVHVTTPERVTFSEDNSKSASRLEIIITIVNLLYASDYVRMWMSIILCKLVYAIKNELV